MPNWCLNRLTIKGTPEVVDKFVEDNKGEGDNALTFTAAAPMPESEKDNCLDWNREHWGTKWDACSSRLSEHGDEFGGGYSAIYDFDTAWAPPIAWFETVVENYPELDFTMEWEEGGMGFAGEIHASVGLTSKIEEWNIEWDEESESYVEMR